MLVTTLIVPEEKKLLMVLLGELLSWWCRGILSKNKGDLSVCLEVWICVYVPNFFPLFVNTVHSKIKPHKA